MFRQVAVFAAGLLIFLLAPANYRAQTMYGPTIAVEGDHFTLNGTPTFLIFVSDFDALRASTSARDTDLSWLGSHGVSGVRIFANWHHWCAGGAVNDGVIAPDGSINEARLSILTDFLVAASQRGLVVDLSFDNELGTAGLSLTQYKTAVATLANRIANFKNVLFDVENEYGLKQIDGHQFGESDVATVLQAVRQSGDSTRRLTASNGAPAFEHGVKSRVATMDISAYHDARDAGIWYTDARASQELNDLRSGLSPSVMPIYFQEPEPFDPGPSSGPNCHAKEYDSDISHADSAIVAAKKYGAAAWTFHNRAAFDMPSQVSLQGGLTAAERTSIEGLRAVADAQSTWGVGAFTMNANKSVGAPSGVDSIGLTRVAGSTGNWYATSNVTWLHLDATQGSGTAVGFSYDTNTSANARSGILTIAGRPVTVTQAGIQTTVALTSSSYQFSETLTTVTLVVQLSTTQALSEGVVVTYATVAGVSATADDDYAPSSGSVTFPAGSVSGAQRSILITLYPDLRPEGNETFVVQLQSVSGGGATLSTPSAGTVTIIDDDPPNVGSFSGDGKPDLVWRNVNPSSPSVGNNGFWEMDGLQVISTPLFQPSYAQNTLPLDWEIRAVADMSGDHNPDVVWQNSQTGELAVWWFSHGSAINTLYLSPRFVTDLNWKIVGAGDMDRDGQTDLIWENHATGAFGIWHMNGSSLRDYVPLTLGSQPVNLGANTPWHVVGVGDVNGDGWPDLFLRDYAGGANGAWTMRDAAVQSTPFLSANQPDVNWRIVGVADFNNDNKPDLVWQHATQGSIGVWYMDGVALTSYSSFNPPVGDTSWQIVGVK